MASASRIWLVLGLAVSTCRAQPDKTIVVLAAHAGDAEALWAAVPDSYGAQGYRSVRAALIPEARRAPAVSVFFQFLDPWILQGTERAYTGSPEWCRVSPPGSVDITTATRRSRTQSEIAAFLAAHNPEIVITHSMGEEDVVRHSAAELVHRAWQEARRKGAHLGELWFRVPKGTAGMISAPAFRRFFEPTRRGEVFVVADARTPVPKESPLAPAPPPVLRPRPGRQPVVMAVAAHSDDVELHFGGTFARLMSQGWKGIYVGTTNNTAGCQLDAYNPSRPGGYFTPRKTQDPFPADALETIQIRQEEARRAAAVYGAEPVFLDLHETFCWIGRRQVYMHEPLWCLYDAPGHGMITSAPAGQGLDLATDLMKKYEPDIVLAMLLGSQNPEHGQTGDLAYRAFVRAAREGARVGQLWMTVGEDAPYPERVRLVPDISFDVAGQVALNRRALAQHVSQNGGHALPERDRPIEHFVVVTSRGATP